MVRRNRKTRKAGKGFKMLVGSRAQVWNGTAYKTSYGAEKSKGGTALTRKDLRKNKHGRIVSVTKSKPSEKKRLLKQLSKAGWGVQKGKFGAIRKTKKASKAKGKKTRRCRHKSGPKKGKFKKC